MFALNIIVYITLIPYFVVGLYLHLSYNIEKMMVNLSILTLIDFTSFFFFFFFLGGGVLFRLFLFICV